MSSQNTLGRYGTTKVPHASTHGRAVAWIAFCSLEAPRQIRIKGVKQLQMHDSQSHVLTLAEKDTGSLVVTTFIMAPIYHPDYY